MARWFSAEGSPFPLGQTWLKREKAYNFSIHSHNATAVTLLLYSHEDVVTPVKEIHLDPRINKYGALWFCRIAQQEVPTARYYGYRIDGPPSGPDRRHCFDSDKIMLDPYAKGIHFPEDISRQAAMRPGSNIGKAPLGILYAEERDIEAPSRRASHHDADTVIYEMHIRGFTQSPTSGVADQHRGTFRGIIEKIPHLVELGVTLVELMPVAQFDPQEGNYWGYMPLNFFSAHNQYASNHEEAKQEFRDMVSAFHDAGIEVVLDVVYNHTTEYDHRGPNYSFKGIDNDTYYLKSGDPNHPYANYTGCGNTLNVSDPYVRTMVLDSLRYWVMEMHVDGFRFDLAACFSRNADGSVNTIDPPLISAIRSDPILRHVHLIAEPWDAAGLYQLGHIFPGRFWHQWNGQFRDDIRRFVRGDEGMVTKLMTRLYGSDDLFPDTPTESCRPFQSINYITSHDGFTLYDLVSYNQKHNHINGWNNTDGPDDNHSWNCGTEGDEKLTPEILQLRKRQARNLFALLMLSNGIPMIRMGDEFLNTQFGNSNPYNQDTPASWLDWTHLKENTDFMRFCKQMIAFRRSHPSICRAHFWREDIKWYGIGEVCDMYDNSHSLAYHLKGARMNDKDLYVMVNAWKEPLTFEIQPLDKKKKWCRAIDTSLESPQDILPVGQELPLDSNTCTLAPYSLVVLIR